MLIKKELGQIPVQKYPDLPEKDIKYSVYVAAVQVLNLPKSGKMLIIDVFERVDSGLKMRFFSDGVNFLLCKEWPARAWVKRIPSDLLLHQYYLSPTDIDATESDIKRAHEILKEVQGPYHYVHGIKDEMDSFVSGIYRKKQEQAMDRKYAKMEEHFEMFPDYPTDLAEYCDTDVFGFTYIFVSKIYKGTRGAICGHCGHNFIVNKEERPGGNTVCPACKMPGKYRAQWSNGTYKDKSKICIAYNFDNQLLIRWTNVTRMFIDSKKKYDFDDYYRNLYLNTAKGPIIYAYDFKPQIGMGYCWFRQKNGAVYYGETFVYANNLREVFGNSRYRVDLQAGLKNTGKLSFVRLLDNLKGIPPTEYLFKLGLVALASDLIEWDLGDGVGFTKVLGVSKQYLSMYRKFNVTRLENRIIKASKTWVNESSFEKLRQIKPDGSLDLGDIKSLLKNMSFEQFVNYFHRQMIVTNAKRLHDTLTLYKDYISMSESLKVDLSRKPIRFPRNIKEAHDLILFRFNQVKHQVEDGKFKHAMNNGLYSGMKEYAKGDYCIVFPVLRSDLITEGQSLSHCVGADRYYKDHIAGTRMIFFVRRAGEPERPYFTMEIDMKELKILQLYGFKDCPAPQEVRKFANEFLKTLKPIREENRIRARVPA